MLKIHVVREGGHRYYVDDLVPGRAEGTLVAGEEPGVWSGDGAAGLGLRGTVEATAFAAVLGGRHPGSVKKLRVPKGARSVAGYDLTFCAPKSVSLLHLLAPGEIAAEAGAGHRAAVAEATGYLGRTALGVRRSYRGEMRFLPSTGLVAGQFLHRTSRALDPHLHTHVVAANMAHGVDGVWSAVDGRRLFAHLQATQAVYHASLRHELTVRLSAAWEVGRSGLGDVVGVDDRMRRLFSGRSAGMDEYVFRRFGPSEGRSPRRGAFHLTRPEKDRRHTVESLRSGWKERAADVGFDLGDLVRVVGLGARGTPPPAIDGQKVLARLDDLARGNRSLHHRDVVAVVASAATAGSPVEAVESAAARLWEAAGMQPDGARGSGRVSGGADRCRAADLAHAVEDEASLPVARDAFRGGGRADRGAERGPGDGGRADRDRPEEGLADVVRRRATFRGQVVSQPLPGGAPLSLGR